MSINDRYEKEKRIKQRICPKRFKISLKDTGVRSRRAQSLPTEVAWLPGFCYTSFLGNSFSY